MLQPPVAVAQVLHGRRGHVRTPMSTYNRKEEGGAPTILPRLPLGGGEGELPIPPRNPREIFYIERFT